MLKINQIKKSDLKVIGLRVHINGEKMINQVNRVMILIKKNKMIIIKAVLIRKIEVIKNI